MEEKNIGPAEKWRCTKQNFILGLQNRRYKGINSHDNKSLDIIRATKDTERDRGEHVGSVKRDSLGNNFPVPGGALSITI